MPVAVITGSGRGIGRALALGLAQSGWSVAGLRRDGATRDELAAGARGILRSYQGDVTDEASLRAAFASATADLGAIDLVVANAGVFSVAGPTWQVDPDAWWNEVTVNLRGAMLTAAVAIPFLQADGGGRLVLVSSGIGSNPSPFATAYGASKAAVTQLAASLDAELEPTPVRVFAISPGMVRTDMTNWSPEYLKYRPDLGELPDSAYLNAEPVLELVRAIGSGEADDLRGRYLHSSDDLAAVRTGVLADPARARHLGLIGYGPQDPLGS